MCVNKKAAFFPIFSRDSPLFPSAVKPFPVDNHLCAIKGAALFLIMSKKTGVFLDTSPE
jgi:hypothetical protein